MPSKGKQATPETKTMLDMEEGSDSDNDYEMAASITPKSGLRSSQNGKNTPKSAQKKTPSKQKILSAKESLTPSDQLNIKKQKTPKGTPKNVEKINTPISKPMKKENKTPGAGTPGKLKTPKETPLNSQSKTPKGTPSFQQNKTPKGTPSVQQTKALIGTPSGKQNKTPRGTPSQEVKHSKEQFSKGSEKFQMTTPKGQSPRQILSKKSPKTPKPEVVSKSPEKESVKKGQKSALLQTRKRSHEDSDSESDEESDEELSESALKDLMALGSDDDDDGDEELEGEESSDAELDDSDVDDSDEEEESEDESSPPLKMKKIEKKVPAVKDSKQSKKAVIQTEDINRKKPLDSRTLFLKNLPNNVTEKKIRQLTSDVIIGVRLPIRKKSHETRGHAFVEFESEAVCDKNYKLLQGKKIDEKEVFVDYVGEKSKKPNARTDPTDYDPKRLYIGGLPSRVSKEELKSVFPKCQDIDLPTRKTGEQLGFAFVHFTKDEDAQKSHDALPVKLRGKELIVLFAKKLSAKAKKRREQLQNELSNPPAKKQKMQPAKVANEKTMKRKAVQPESSSEDEEDDEDESFEEEDEVHSPKKSKTESSSFMDNLEEDSEDDDDEESEDDEEDDDDEEGSDDDDDDSD